MPAWGPVKEPLRLGQPENAPHDPEPVALACYGLWCPALNPVWLRFVKGRPISHVTVAFRAWGCERLVQAGKKAWLLVWDKASWHRSHELKTWIQQHNRKAKAQGGIRIIIAHLPIKSPWLNPIEAHWIHGKRAIVEPQRSLTAPELRERVCAY